VSDLGVEECGCMSVLCTSVYKIKTISGSTLTSSSSMGNSTNRSDLSLSNSSSIVV